MYSTVYKVDHDSLGVQGLTPDLLSKTSVAYPFFIVTV